jgi:hypothetical protein
MADYGLIGLNKAVPDGRVPTSADRGLVFGGLRVSGMLESLTGIYSVTGSAPNQAPLNQLLGSLAYYDRLPAISFANVAPTVASATSIIISAPVTFVSGTTAIETIAAPDLTATGGAQITLIPTGIFTTTTAGNIALATTAVVSRALTLTYDSATAKWYPSY